MKIIWLAISILLMCWPICKKANASDTIRWKEIDLKASLSMPSITDIEYDKSGNLWMSTFSGIVKYDGYEIKRYTENENNGLVKNKIRSIHKDQEGKIWFAGEYSIYRYNERHDQIERMNESLRSEFKKLYTVSFFDICDLDSEHKILGTKQGVWIYHTATKKTTKHIQIVDSLIIDKYSSNDHVLKIIPHSNDDNYLWILSKNGVYKFNKTTLQSKHIGCPFSKNKSRFGDRGHSIIDTKSHIYILVNMLNIYQYDKASKQWNSVPIVTINKRKKYIRNLLPFKEGFLIIYIDHHVEYYNAKTKQRSFLNDLYPSKAENHSHSTMSYDHSGRLVFIYNNQKICKSDSSYFNSTLIQTIFTKNLKIEGQKRPDSVIFDQLIVLPSYQRSLSFDIGLTNRTIDSQEQFYYKNGINNKWNKIKDNSIELNDLSYGTHKIFVKVKTGSNQYEALVKQFYIQPFFYETWWFLSLVILSLLGVGSVILNLSKIRKRETKKYKQQLLLLEMNALRSQMNPHFLFNSLNSIKNYVVSKSRDEAADYLTDFARLIRMILENSQKKILTLEEEINMLKLYIEMECRRLNNSFTYIIEISPEVDKAFLLPPLLLQPFLENAIWHGLMSKYGNKHLSLSIDNTSEGIRCRIRDNGIGRAASLKMRKGNHSSKKSLALKITSNRFKIFGQMYDINTSYKVIDHYDKMGNSNGTEVNIHLPRINDKFNELKY